MKRLQFLIAVLAFPGMTGMAQDTIRYIINFGDRKAGQEKVWKSPDGSWNDYYEFNDRGRGPSITTHYMVDDQGYPVQVEATGKNYLKNEVTETFSFKDGLAQWENESEKGEKKLAAPAFYIPINGNAGNMLKLLSESKSKSIDLLPAGRATLSLSKPFEMTLDGKPTRLILCGVTGMGLAPVYSWCDANYDFVGTVGEWYSGLREGYQDLRKEMYAYQKSEEDAYFYRLASELTGKQEKLAITNVRVFDSKQARLLPLSTVLVDKGLITNVGNVSALKIPAGYRIIDGGGKFLMPGMWDMHVHYSEPSDGILHMAAGVTNVRDMANTTSLIGVRDEINDRKLLGPRISAMCGFIDGAGPYAGPTGEIISSVDEGIRAVNKYADLGYPQIKLYSSIKPEWVAPLTAEARKRGMRVSGHIPAFMTASEAIDAGYNEIQHINMLFLNFYGKDKDTRTPLRFSLVADQAASFDFDSPDFKAFMAKMKAKNIVSDPTLSVFEEMFTSKPGQPNPVYASIKDRLPATVQRSVQTFGGLPANGKEEIHNQSFEACLKLLKTMFDDGITIVAGTDAMPGFAYQRELELYARSGIPNAEVLKIATYNGASVAGKSDVLGSIESGKIADMILVDGDPLSNMSDIRKVQLVVKDGIVYETAKLYQAIAIRP